MWSPFWRVLPSKNSSYNQLDIINIGLKPMLFHVCFVFESEALLDITYLVCCLMKIHVRLKRDNRRGAKSLED